MKKRPFSHVTNSAGERLLRSLLPEEWVIRNYQPDYGVDFAVEVFDSRGDDTFSLGEHFLVQLKSHKEVRWVEKKIWSRKNLEKPPVDCRSEFLSTRVIAQKVETSLIQLARSMGPAEPLILAVADVKNTEAYWVCLNDYVDKILIPEKGQLSSQDSHTIYLPCGNRIELNEQALTPLKFISRRAKLYAAFNRFRYQCNEVSHALDQYSSLTNDLANESGPLHIISHFLRSVLAFDFWESTDAWKALEIGHLHAATTADLVARKMSGESLELILPDSRASEIGGAADREESLDFLFDFNVRSTFSYLASLGMVFEEVCREWYLPTYLGLLADGRSEVNA